MRISHPHPFHGIQGCVRPCKHLLIQQYWWYNCTIQCTVASSTMRISHPHPFHCIQGCVRPCKHLQRELDPHLCPGSPLYSDATTAYLWLLLLLTKIYRHVPTQSKALAPGTGLWKVQHWHTSTWYNCTWCTHLQCTALVLVKGTTFASTPLTSASPTHHLPHCLLPLYVFSSTSSQSWDPPPFSMLALKTVMVVTRWSVARYGVLSLRTGPLEGKFQ